MILTLQVFRAAVRVLQNNSIEEVGDTLDSVRNHLSVLNQNYQIQLEKLSKSVVFYKKFESQMEWNKFTIHENELANWIPLLQQHKKASAFPDVKAATVKKIVGAKKEMDRIDLSKSELKLRLMEYARKVRETEQEIKRTNTQVFVLEVAAALHPFLLNYKYNAGEIAEYEIEKYFDLFRKEADI